MTNVVFRKLSGWVGALACAGLLAACGGGGGSPGATANNPNPNAPKVASVVVSANSLQLASSGQAGTEVTLTALVKDSSNTAVAGATVKFTASSGAVGAISGVSDASGIVTAKLSTGGDATLRDITVTANASGVDSAPITIKVVQATQTLTLTTDSGTLASSGATDVTVTALVRDSNNSILPGVKVTLSADTGTLTVASNITDAQGKVTAKLSTGGDATSRVIKVTGSIDAVAPVTVSVSVVGSTVKVSTNPTVNVNTNNNVSVQVTDSAGHPLVNKPVAFASNVANSLTVSGGGSAVTDSAGQLTLIYKVAAVPTGGSDTIVVRSMGESASASVLVSASNFTVTSSQAVANINTCVLVTVHSDNGGVATVGSVVLGSSRGTVYSDSGCTTTAGATALNGTGDATFYVKATNPGMATLSANIVNGGTSQGTMEFVAPLLSSATITLQADPAVIGTNITGSTSEQATIRALVRDGTPANNLVKNAQVTFSIDSDSSGGKLSLPILVSTGADGAATVNFIAGSGVTALNGVVIRGTLQGASTASNTTSLTVSKRSLFISAGTGRDVGTPDSNTYSKSYSVLVTDASGNAVPGVNVTASVLPRHYRKGKLVYFGTDGPWSLPTQLVTGALPYACPNEDVNNNGLMDAGEDTNGNLRLDPGIPVSVTAAGVTDTTGRTTVTLSYARSNALWLGVDLTIRGSVSGSEAVYVAYIPILPGLSTDYSDAKVLPPGGTTSPFGQTNTYSATDCTIAN